MTASRNTRQRAVLTSYIASQAAFRTAQQVHEDLRAAGESVGLTTVYRTLSALADLGEVDSVRTPDGEMAYRSCSDGHHHHLICRSCGTSVEVAGTVVESWAATIAAENGFSDVEHELEFFGLCPACTRS